MSTNNLSSPASGRFSLSAAALHILAMVLMLMDHLWATLLPAQDWLTCAGRLAFPIFAFMAVEGYFHTHSFRKYALRLALFAVLSEVPFDLMYGGTWFYPVHQNVIWTLLLGLLGIHLMETVRKKTKNMAVSAHRPACCADRHSAGHPEHGGLLRHRRADDLYLLLLSRTEVVVSGRAASRPLLGQWAAAGRSAVSRPYIRHGI